MATIPKSGIALSQVIQPSHTLSIINALDGTDVVDVVVSGSLSALQLTATGSLKGSASYALTASHATNVPVTASYALSGLSSSYALTASYATNAGSGGFPYTGSAVITGSLQVTGSIVTGLYSKTQSNKVNIAASSTTDVLSILSGSSAGSIHLNYFITNGGDRVRTGTLLVAYNNDGSRQALSDIHTTQPDPSNTYSTAVTFGCYANLSSIYINAVETAGVAYTMYYNYTILNNSY